MPSLVLRAESCREFWTIMRASIDLILGNSCEEVQFWIWFELIILSSNLITKGSLSVSIFFSNNSCVFAASVPFVPPLFEDGALINVFVQLRTVEIRKSSVFETYSCQLWDCLMMFLFDIVSLWVGVVLVCESKLWVHALICVQKQSKAYLHLLLTSTHLLYVTCESTFTLSLIGLFCAWRRSPVGLLGRPGASLRCSWSMFFVLFNLHTRCQLFKSTPSVSFLFLYC